ncbi:MAG: CRISPR-associated endonuclease Cas2 [Geminicoccaceae bacterium]|nr:CRISPR-associated endonuclease Cas2 [Geminicoccaceae bacterium]MDW8371698.1 CRISPR-associated endonuclease Cas2 [Geminicoccaceae bacterium]
MSARRGIWLVAYDVASPKRLGRVHRFMVRRGLPTQYSVFLVEADRAAIEELVGALARLVHPKQDDVRIFRLDPTFGRSLGVGALPRFVLATPPRVPAILRRSPRSNAVADRAERG